MTNARLRDSVGGVAAFEHAYHPSSAPGLSTDDQRVGKTLEILNLEGEPAQRVSGERIEAGRNENQIRNEALRGLVDSLFERGDVLTPSQSTGLGDVPDRAVRTAILSGARPRIPRPLM